jgi:hypothetical protein
MHVYYTDECDRWLYRSFWCVQGTIGGGRLLSGVERGVQRHATTLVSTCTHTTSYVNTHAHTCACVRAHVLHVVRVHARVSVRPRAVLGSSGTKHDALHRCSEVHECDADERAQCCSACVVPMCAKYSDVHSCPWCCRSCWSCTVVSDYQW